MESALILLLVVLVTAVLTGILLYNRMVRFRQMVVEGWSGIEVQMKRRYDLVPNLVETVKGYKTHEAELLMELTQARTSAVSNHGSPAEQADSENQLQGALMNVLAVAENYPELKSDTQFSNLQSELSECEDQLQRARRYYNGAVRQYNVSTEQFPGVLIAKQFGFLPAEYFELAEDDAEARDPVAVKF